MRAARRDKPEHQRPRETDRKQRTGDHDLASGGAAPAALRKDVAYLRRSNKQAEERDAEEMNEKERARTC